MRKRASAIEVVGWIESLTKHVADAAELLELGAADSDEEIVNEVEAQVLALEQRVRKAELQRMLFGPGRPHAERHHVPAFTPARAARTCQGLRAR